MAKGNVRLLAGGQAFKRDTLVVLTLSMNIAVLIFFFFKSKNKIKIRQALFVMLERNVGSVFAWCEADMTCILRASAYSIRLIYSRFEKRRHSGNDYGTKTRAKRL